MEGTFGFESERQSFKLAFDPQKQPNPISILAIALVQMSIAPVERRGESV